MIQNQYNVFAADNKMTHEITYKSTTPVCQYKRTSAYGGTLPSASTRTPLSLLISALLVSGGLGVVQPVHAENIIYDGGALMTDPFTGYLDAFIPSTSSNNTVTVISGSPKTVYGGASNETVSTSDAESGMNTVVIEGGSIGAGGVYGGIAKSDSGSATANTNTVTMNGGSVAGSVWGGVARSETGGGISNGNKVYIYGSSTVNENVVGGDVKSSSGNGTANNNVVEINLSGTGKVSGYVAGGEVDISTGDAQVIGNRVTITGAGSPSIGNDVMGGVAIISAGTIKIDTNTVQISDSHVKGDIYGGYGYGYTSGSTDATVEVTGNTVSLDNVTITTGKKIYGGLAQSTVTSGDNTVIADQNTVNIIGGSVDEVFGGSAEAKAIKSTVSASNNTVSITGANVGNITGGNALAGTGNSTLTVTGNRVDINGGSVTGDIMGGNVNSRSGNTFKVTNNTVTLAGDPTLATTTELWGGRNMSGEGSGDLFADNTLIIKDSITSQVANIANFQKMELMITDTVPAITTGTLTLGDGTTNTTINRIDVTGGSNSLNVGQVVTVIGVTGSVTDNGLTTTSSGQQGVIFDYTYDDIKYDASAATGAGVVARVATKSLKSTTDVIPQGGLSQLALYGQASNLMIQQLLPLVDELQPGNGAQAFFIADHGKSSYETGSHSDVKGYTMMAGAASNTKTSFGNLALGAFVEYGSGNYNSSGTYGGVHAKTGGDSSFTGVGVLGRFNWDNNFYVDGSIHTGKSKSDFSSNDLAFGQRAKYDISGKYIGAHVGVGYIMPINQQMKLDMSMRYRWNRIDGDTAVILGDRFKFDSITSERLRVGGKLSYSMDRFTPYVGLYYDHEFDGKATGSVYGNKIKGVKVTGGTTNAEVGFKYRPDVKNNALLIDLGLQGYAGKREGYSGVLKANWAF